MAYDNLHNITSKKQHIQQQGIQFDGMLKAGYDLTYEYNSQKPHQIANLKDENYRTEGSENQDKIKKDHTYQYDANGNLVYVNTAREKHDPIMIDLSVKSKTYGSIFYYCPNITFSSKPVPIYDSLFTWIKTVIECYEKNIYNISEEGKLMVIGDENEITKKYNKPYSFWD